ncbi:MAG: DUF917 domain-containing protein [Pseudomonadota bacterium]
MARTLSRVDLMDMLHGAAILGTGGGGEIEEGIQLIDAALAAGKTFQLADLGDAPPDALICTPYMLGAISEIPAEEDALYEGLPQSDTHPILLAYDAFEAMLGQRFWGTVPCELGGSNTAIAFYAAAMRGAVMCDADPAGRAVPEITHSTYFLNDLPAAPIVMANQFGEHFVAQHIKDDQRAETLVRALSVVSRHDIAAIDHALPAAQIMGAILPGTISRAIKLGALWRAGLHDPLSLPSKIARAAGGFVAFEGEVSDASWRTEAGFTLGAFSLAGIGDYEGHRYRVTLKNENVAAWFDGALQATVPDLICALDLQTGAPLTNPNAQAGQRVAIVILPADPAFTTDSALRVFGPAYAGVDQAYRPAVPAPL